MTRVRPFAALLMGALLNPVSLAFAAPPPPSVTDPFAVRLDESANDGNFATGDIFYFGANSVVPSTSPPSYGLARQCPVGATCPSPTPFNYQALFTQPFSLTPDRWHASVPYDPSLTGPWSLIVSSTPNFALGTYAVVSTPAVGDVAAMPYVTSMAVSGAGLTPTISWVLPSDSPDSIDLQRVVVFDNSTPIDNVSVDPFFSKSFQTTNAIYTSGPLTSTSFQIPAGVLNYGDSYSIAVQLGNLRPSATLSPSCYTCSLDAMSQSFFDFTPINGATLGIGDAAVNLPMTKPISTTSGLVSDVLYSFNVTGVGPDQTTYIDPLEATGFIYTIGASDPNFKSVDAVTDVGDGIYDLSVWNGTQWLLVDPTLDAGQVFDFTDNGYLSGVSKFEITGIDPGLDPTDLTAFVTGLTFVSDGSFTGTMQPIVQDVGVPEPGSLALLGAGVGILMTFRRRKRRIV